MKKRKARQLVMIVDDNADMLDMLRMVMNKKCDCDIKLADSGVKALKVLETCSPDVIISDIKMPDLDGLTLLKKIRQKDETISIIIMTGYGTIEMAVQALKDGAHEFVEKPFDKDHIVRITANCLERTRLLRENQKLQKQLRRTCPSRKFIGQSPALQQALHLIAKVADTDATVLVRGESGTGKEGAARSLHTLSSRRNRKMIIVNCPALPEQILESELFGYCKGAFTGADKDKKGLFLAADHSTILLDEIADIPVSIQTKLLRVLQEKEIQPLGGNERIKVDVRVVASTNQDLETKIKSGEFREDLFYRLNVITVTMPKLQQMQEDIPLLVHHFLERYKKEYDRPQLSISPESLHYLQQKSWPGNVRQLQNSIKSAVLLSAADTIELSELCDADNISCQCPDQLTMADRPYNEAKAEIIKKFSVSYMSHLLIGNNGNVTLAAKQSGLERQAFQRIMRRYSIHSADFKNK